MKPSKWGEVGGKLVPYFIVNLRGEKSQISLPTCAMLVDEKARRKAGYLAPRKDEQEVLRGILAEYAV